MGDRKHLLHVKSNVAEKTKQYGINDFLVTPKKPVDLLYGEIAVNYGKGVEALTIRNTEDNVVAFVNENDFHEAGEIAADGLATEKLEREEAFNYLNNKIDTSAVSEMVSITYAEIKVLRDNSKLKPSQYYRITDFVTTVANDPEARSAGHPFDIIVMASEKDKLQEECYAIQHEGDTYFANCNLAAWKIWYCLDNDNTKYAWADTANGKGVIYRMIDEWNNDCPYDFKNVQFKRYWANGINIAKQEGELKDIILQGYYGTVSNTDIFTEGIDNHDYLFCFTFTRLNNILVEYGKGSVIQSNVLDESIQTEGFDIDAKDDKLNNQGFYNFHNRCRNNILKPTETGLVVDTKEYMTFILLNDVFITVKESDPEVYHPPFDNTLGVLCVNNTFGSNIYGLLFLSCCINNTFGNDCYHNTFGNICNGNTFGNSCSSNTFGNNCGGNTFGNYCGGNTFGNECDSNKFGNNCGGNTFGNSCGGNKFGNNCRYNTFGNSCSSNTFGNTCESNTFGNSCQNNTFGDDCQNNKFGNGCHRNTFVNNCVYNTFGGTCQNNTFGNGCHRNTFVNSCESNTFGDYCGGNTFGNYCSTNKFGNSCSSNTFGNYCSTNKFGNSCSSNTFGDGCQFINFTKDYMFCNIVEKGNIHINVTSDQTTSSSVALRNFTIAQGVNNTEIVKVIHHETVNDIFKTTYQNASSKTVNV